MAKSKDEIKELQRSVNRLQRSDGAVLHLGGQPYLVPLEAVADPDALIELAARPDVPEGEVVQGLARGCRLRAPARQIEGRWLGALQRDLRILEKHPDLAGLSRQAPRLFRGQVLDRAWIAERRERLGRLQEAVHDDRPRPSSPWEATLALVRGLHGEAAAAGLAEIHERSVRRDIRETRNNQQQLALCLGRYGLLFPPGPDRGLRFDDVLLRQALRCWPLVREQLAGLTLRLEQVLELLRLPGLHGDLAERGVAKRVGHQLEQTGHWVADGMEVELLQEVGRLQLLEEVVDQDWDVEAARAYCSWVTRLAPHYRTQGIELALTPDAFERLREARHEELAVLGHCLLAYHAPSAPSGGRPASRQMALLDATLAMFQKLPDRARLCLEGLDLSPAGLADEICPDFAAWLEHDPHLDRYLHLCGLLGVPRVPSKSLLRDFESARRRAAELAFLSGLAEPGAAQRQRIALLARSAPPPGPAWTKRRLAERTEDLAVRLLERRIDQALADVLLQAFGLALHRVTPAWRDVFRFYLSTDDNRELLGLLLRQATAAPGRYFPPSLPKNRPWLEAAADRMQVDAWLRPRRRPVEVGGKRYTLEVEEDPIEVLRMGVPFDTCLSLTNGLNAASTVINALDVNKRVLYLKDAAGKLAARQLIAVSEDFALLRYRVYSALGPEREAEIAPLFRAFCEEIAGEAGLPLGDGGEPQTLHDGFWYDDGVEPFTVPAVTALAAEYCHFLGLPVPPETEALREDAELWAAVEARDLGRFQRTVVFWSVSLGKVELGRRLIGEVGLDKAARRVRAGARDLLVAVLRHCEAQGPEALLRAARPLVQGTYGSERVYDLVRSLPMSPAVLEEMAALATHLAARSVPFDDHGIEHGTLHELPRAALRMKLEKLFDLCDRLTPVWDRLVAQETWCLTCRGHMESQLLAAAEAIFVRDPDTRAVVSCLRSKRRGDLSQRIALRILSLFPFPRQSGQPLAVSLLDGLERAPSDAPWARQALRELALRRPDLALSSDMRDAWRLQGAGAEAAGVFLKDPDEEKAVGPEELEARREALAVLRRHGGVLAAADAASHPDLARTLDVLVTSNLPDNFWIWWLAEVREQAHGALGPLLVDALALWLTGRREHLLWLLEPGLVLWLWSFPPLREPLLDVLGRMQDSPEVRRFALGMNEAARDAGLDPRELLERWVVAVLDQGHAEALTCAGDREILDLATRAVLSRARPEQWVELYDELPDPLSASIFLRELALRPEPVRRKLRSRVPPLVDGRDDQKIFRFWLDRALAGSA